MKFSVVIPIYNGVEYLEDCIVSLMAQDYDHNDYEVIVVDDASTQDVRGCINNLINSVLSSPPPYTLGECSNPCKLRYVRHEYNKRQGGARNTGLRQAKGDYLFFLDSDDYWNATNTLSVFDNLINKYPNADMVRSLKSANFNEGDQPSFNYISYDDADGEELSGSEYLLSSKFTYVVWTTCYRRDYLLNNNIFFRENVYFEDSDWSVMVAWKASRIRLVDFSFCMHRIHSESTAMKPSKASLMGNVVSLHAIDDYVRSTDMPLACRYACYSRIKKSLTGYILYTRKFPVGVSIECFRNIRRSLLTDMTLYNDLTRGERVKLWLLKNMPITTASVVKLVVLIKRIILKCLQR